MLTAEEMENRIRLILQPPWDTQEMTLTVAGHHKITDKALRLRGGKGLIETFAGIDGEVVQPSEDKTVDAASASGAAG